MGIFKRCSYCSTEWKTREDFLDDPENRFDGYVYVRNRVVRGEEAGGMLLFTHLGSACGTTMTVEASKFRSDGTHLLNTNHLLK